MSDRIWLTWERQRRNRTTSRALGARLFEMRHDAPRPVRYARAVAETARALARERPRLIFAQNPSIVLAALATHYGKLSRVPVVVDAHNAGVHPFDGERRWANVLNRRVMRAAALTIVTNEGLADVVREQGGRPAVLPDPLPHLPRPETLAELEGKFNVLFICTWAPDEPYLEVLRAAREISGEIHVYVTGKSRGRERELGAPLPENVHLTGFVPEEEFVRLLFSADLVVDLTTREDCLVCGAYEGVAAGRPLLLSDTRALREYFDQGVLYTDNTARDIAARIEEARRRQPELEEGIAALERAMAERWQARRDALERTLAKLESG